MNKKKILKAKDLILLNELLANYIYKNKKKYEIFLFSIFFSIYFNKFITEIYNLESEYSDLLKAYLIFNNYNLLNLL